jgi:hypothetical protein
MSQSILGTCLYFGHSETFVRFINAPYDDHCFAISLHEFKRIDSNDYCVLSGSCSRAHAPLQRCPRNASSFTAVGDPAPPRRRLPGTSSIMSPHDVNDHAAGTWWWMMACNVAWALVAAICLLSVNSQKENSRGKLKVLKSSAFWDFQQPKSYMGN